MIKTLNEFSVECEKAPRRCLYFYRSGSTQCDAMHAVLSDICTSMGFSLMLLEMSNKEFFPIVDKYNVKGLPGFVFVDGDQVLLNMSGAVRKFKIKQALKRSK